VPLVKVPGATNRWALHVSAYVVAGMTTSTGVGVALAWLGMQALPTHASAFLLPAVLAVAVATTLSNARLLRLSPPQFRRQTSRDWAMRFKPTFTAALWGFDIGLFFTTRITLLAAWILPLLAFGLRDPLLGAAIFAAYWLGRVSPVLAAPVVLRDASATAELVDAVSTSHPQIRRVATLALILAVGALLGL
jgi:hypothetical protein